MEFKIEKEQDYDNKVEIVIRTGGEFMSPEDMSTIQDSANTIINLSEKYFAPPKVVKSNAES